MDTLIMSTDINPSPGFSRVRFSGFTFFFTILILVTISYLLTNVMLLFSFIFFVLLFVYFV
jgi:hypothetical protein